MPVKAGFIVPHPPLIIPAVGCGQENKISSTVEAYKKVAREVARLAPDTIIFITPHSVIYADYFHISPGKSASGDFSRFGVPQAKYSLEYDTVLVETLTRVLRERELDGGILGEKTPELDHGTMIPVHFINQEYTGYRAVRISQSGLDKKEHYRLGMALREAVDVLDINAVCIASGDLSHKLKIDGPYGLAEEGAVFDNIIMEVMKSGDFSPLMELEEGFCEKAAECGLRSFIVMAGIFDGKKIQSEFLSYEKPFGVGYGVGSFICGETPQDDFVRLARYTLEGYVTTGKLPELSMDFSDELFSSRAGVFVCIKKFGELRGCIGTIMPTRPNIAGEIMYNAISSGLRDGRFSPVTAEELPYLTYSVDVLEAPEQIPDISWLDVKRYGVIVTCGHKRGLLLPNLDSVDTPEEQLDIACRKGGIDKDEPYILERFRVVRHE